MKRSIFDVLPEFDGKKDFIDLVMSENGADIEKAKKSADASTEELERTKEELSVANDTIKKLMSSAQDVDALRSELDELKKREAEAIEKKNAEVYEANMRERFKNAVGDSKFVNSFTEDGAFDTFKKAVEVPENKGKSDKDIFASISVGNDSWFVGEHSFVNIEGMGNVDASILDKEKFDKMTLIQKMQFANEHPDAYDKLSKL